MKKFMCHVLICSMLVLFSSGYALAMSSDEVYILLDKVVNTQNATMRDMGIKILKDYLDKDTPNVDGLKKLLKVFGASYEDKIEEQGYKFDDVINSLDMFKTMTRDDRKGVISAIEAKDSKKIKTILSKYDDNTSDKNNQSSSNSSSSNTTTNSNAAFRDIEKHWAKDDINFLLSQGIISKTSSGNYMPDSNITRAEFIDMLVKALKLHENSSTYANFTDVSQSDSFYKSVKIANQNGIVLGDSNNKFNPNEKITREQLVSMIMRANNVKFNEANLKNITINNFNDKNNVSSWAVDNMNKALSLGIIQGVDDKNVKPQGFATKAQACSIIKRVIGLTQ